MNRHRLTGLGEICPHCNAQFTQLKQHLTKKHRQYTFEFERVDDIHIYLTVYLNGGVLRERELFQEANQYGIEDFPGVSWEFDLDDKPYHIRFLDDDRVQVFRRYFGHEGEWLRNAYLHNWKVKGGIKDTVR